MKISRRRYARMARALTSAEVIARMGSDISYVVAEADRINLAKVSPKRKMARRKKR